jgi:hypothetical protein
LQSEYFEGSISPNRISYDKTNTDMEIQASNNTRDNTVICQVEKERTNKTYFPGRIYGIGFKALEKLCSSTSDDIILNLLSPKIWFQYFC